MNFSQALAGIETGKWAEREAWAGKAKIGLAMPANVIAVQTAKGIAPWMPTQPDIRAQDWMIYNLIDAQKCESSPTVSS